MKRISLALVAMFALSPYAFAGEEIQLAAAIGSGAEAGGTMGGAGTTVAHRHQRHPRAGWSG